MHAEGLDPLSAIELFGMDPRTYRDTHMGEHGYHSSYRASGSTMVVNARGNQQCMGIRFDIPCEAIACLEQAFCVKYRCAHEKWIKDFVQLVFSLGGKFTRIDLSLDDIGGHYFRLKTLQRYDKRHQIVTLFRSIGKRGEHKTNGEDKGTTLYFGHASSKIMLRIYEKDKQSKGAYPDGTVRWEFQMRKERAQAMAQRLAEDGDIGKVFTGLLNHYMRIVNNDNVNVSRKTTLKKWNKFIGDAAPIKLSESRKEFNPRNALQYAKGALPTIAAVYAMLGFDKSMMDKLLKQSLEKASSDLKDFAANYAKDDNAIDIYDFFGIS